MADNYTFTAEVIGADEMARAFAKAGAMAPKYLADALNKTAFTIQPAAAEKAPADTGQLRASIHTEIASERVLEAKVGTNVKHAWPMETGSKPHYVSPQVLKPWARRKFGNEGIAYAVAKTIARRGVKGRRYMIGAFTDKKSAFTNNMRAAIDAIMGLLRS